MKLWRNCWLSSGRELGQNRSLLIARNIQQEKAIVDITPQNVMKTVIKYINLFWHGVGRCWRGSEFSRTPLMHGAGLCLLWPLGPTLEFGVWAFLVWTFTCEVSLLPCWASACSTGNSHAVFPFCHDSCEDVLGSPGGHTSHLWKP